MAPVTRMMAKNIPVPKPAWLEVCTQKGERLVLKTGDFPKEVCFLEPTPFWLA